MSVLEKIRSKTGLLVGIVGLALVIFILESLLGSGSAFFANNDTLVGKIDGDKVDYTAFRTKVDEQIMQIQQSNPQATIDEKTREQIVEQVWNRMINDKVIDVQYKKLGITVSEDELYDLMLVHPHQYVLQQLTDQKTGQVYEGFARPDGSLDVVKLNQWVSQMNADQEKFWLALEKQILDVRTAEKYNTLIKKGLYVTTAEAKDAFIAQNKQMNANFVMKRYASVSDSAVKVSDEDITNYYNKHQNDYKVTEASRKIEYVAFDVMPSKKDYEELMKDAVRTAEDFKTKTAKEDSSFISQESEGGQILFTNHTKKDMIISDSTVYGAPKGTVFGPYTEGTFIKVYKLTDTKSVADSGKVRHLLLAYAGSERSQATRTKEQAKKTADSLLTVLKAGGSFDQLVDQFSDDGGKRKPNVNFSDPMVQPQLSQILFDVKDTNSWRGRGGNYGWIKAVNSGMAPAFAQGATENNKGDLFIKESSFGYHIMQVLDVSKSRFNQYTVATISKLIGPSAETTQEYFKQASDFAGKNQTGEVFEKSVEAEKLNKRIADAREGDKNLPGLDNSKDLVRWMYRSKKGDISPVFEFKDRFIVANLVGVKEKGIAPLEEVKDDVTIKAIRDKKAEQFIAEFTSKAGASKSIDDIASKMALTVEKADNLTFASYNVAAIGREDALIGTAAGMKAGSISKAIKGDNGVFVVNVASINEAVLPKDFKGKQREIEQASGSKVDYELYDALKEKANIEDHRGKFDF